MTTPRRVVAAWVLYDLANTLFFFGVIGFYFPTWLAIVTRSPDSALAWAEAAAGVVVIFLAPLVGARTDLSGRRVPALRISAGIAAAATLLIGRFSVVGSLVALAVALVAFHVGAAVYDSLLPAITSPEQRGRVSGLGVGVGYLGSFLGLGAGTILLANGATYSTVFNALGFGFLVFAIPACTLIKEQASLPKTSTATAGVLASWRKAASVPGIRRFLFGRFLYTDAINTLISGFLVIYLRQELGFTDTNTRTLVATAIAASLLGGLLGGWCTDRYGAKPTLLATLGLWLVAMALAAVTRQPALAWAVGPLGGIALGSTWTSDRVLMAGLTPTPLLGEFYGLYATVGRFASVLGPLLWVFVAETLDWGRRAAVVSLAGLVLIAFVVLRGLPQNDSVSPAVNLSSTA